MLKILIFLFIILFPSQLFSQNSRKSLENKRKVLSKEIQKTSYLLGKTSKDRQQSLQQLTSLKKQIESHVELIKILKEELDSINKVLIDKQEEINRYSEDLNKLKAAYRKILILLYRYKTGNDISVFLIAADRYKRNFERQIYLSRLEKKGTNRVILNRKIQRNLKIDINDLEVQKYQVEDLICEEQEQNDTLNKELLDKDQLVKSLKTKEQKLKSELKKKESAKQLLNNKIETIIKEQIAASKKKSRSYKNTKSKASNSKKRDSYLKPPDYSDSGSAFAKKKGKLPSPVNSGVIISKFGKQRHPVFEEVFSYNNGIDIKTVNASKVKAVHKGTVISIFAVPGNGNAVMLKHGDYYTTYSNLNSVNVKRGETVNAGQSLGVVGKDMNSKHYILHFELWHGKNKENPELWLCK